MRHTDVPNGFSYDTTRASRKLLAQEANIKDARMQPFRIHEGQEAYNVDEDIDNENKELVLDREQAQTTECGT